MLDNGPELLKLLFQLQEFSEFVLAAGMQNAFLQICIRSEDRYSVRFLSIDQPQACENPVPTLVEWCMTRFPIVGSSIPFLLPAALQHYLETWKTEHPDTATPLQRSTYVDDLVIGASSE
ncbi:hypothetical protein MTO96_028797 [Rhipicephalus appendiculatus]